MRAFVFSEAGKIEERELPKPELCEEKPEDRRAAVLRPRYLTPCASDVHTVFSGNGPRRENLVLGHEGLAEIVELGSEVKDFRAGELVAVSAVMPEVEDGNGHENSPFSGSQLGRSRNGMWAERFYVPEADRNLAHIPEGVSTEQALMSVDVMATGFSAAEEAEILPGQTVVIFGLGAIGLMALCAAARMGAGRLIAVGSDSRPELLELAKGYGIDLLISYKDGSVLYRSEAEKAREEKLQGTKSARHPLSNATGSAAVDRVLDLTGNRGAERVLICGGGREVLAQACDIAAYGTGVVVNVAYLSGNGMAELPIFSLGRGMAGKTFRFVFCRGGRHRIETLLALCRKAETGDPGKLVTHRLKGFERIPEALSMMREKPEGLIKVMVEIP